jgi:magnesium chelatase subunit I
MQEYLDETQLAQAEIQIARDILPEVTIPESVTDQGLELIRSLKIDSLRAEITLFEAIKALAALDNRKVVDADDLRVIAPMALRMRRSGFIGTYLTDQSKEDDEINKVIDETIK